MQDESGPSDQIQVLLVTLGSCCVPAGCPYSLGNTKLCGTKLDRLRQIQALPVGSLWGAAASQVHYSHDKTTILETYLDRPHQMHARSVTALWRVLHTSGVGLCLTKNEMPVLFPLPPNPPPLPARRGASSKTTKTRRKPFGPRKTHGHSLLTAGVSLPLADPLLTPERHSQF